jgi:hypothetical protein
LADFWDLAFLMGVIAAGSAARIIWGTEKALAALFPGVARVFCQKRGKKGKTDRHFRLNSLPSAIFLFSFMTTSAMACYNLLERRISC